MKSEILGPQHVGMNEYPNHPAIDLALSRHRSAYYEGVTESKDSMKLVLVSEGGGYSGYVAAAGQVVLEQSGLITSAFDETIGASAGAFNSASTAAKQAARGSSNYVDLLNTDFANPFRLLARRKPLNFDRLIRDIILDRKPIDINDLKQGLNFGAVSTNIETGKTELLQDFEDVPDLLLAMRASSAIPILTGPPIKYKGKILSDGGLLAAVPFKDALANGPEGNTFVVALRTCGEDLRKKNESRREVEIVRRHPDGGHALAELVVDRARIYNEDADNLQAGDVYPNVAQIALKGADRPVQRIEKTFKALQYGFELGAAATAKAFGMPNISVFWDIGGIPIVLTETR